MLGTSRYPTTHGPIAQQLAAQESELVRQIAKDAHNFEFLGPTGEVAERDLEQSLMDRIIDNPRESGPGFAFVGKQVHVDVGGDDFYVNLLFFHVEQLRYIVIELKTGKVQPEHAGQLNFNATPVDDRLRRDAHADTVGILIREDKNDHIVRYSLGRAISPLAVASYTCESLPARERAGLPDDEAGPSASDQQGPAGLKACRFRVTRPRIGKEKALRGDQKSPRRAIRVELRRFELLTSSMRTRRATNCAIAP